MNKPKNDEANVPVKPVQEWVGNVDKMSNVLDITTGPKVEKYLNGSDPKDLEN